MKEKQQQWWKISFEIIIFNWPISIRKLMYLDDVFIPFDNFWIVACFFVFFIFIEFTERKRLNWNGHNCLCLVFITLIDLFSFISCFCSFVENKIMLNFVFISLKPTNTVIIMRIDEMNAAKQVMLCQRNWSRINLDRFYLRRFLCDFFGFIDWLLEIFWIITLVILNFLENLEIDVKCVASVK